jgi:hypothetical protein
VAAGQRRLSREVDGVAAAAPAPGCARGAGAHAVGPRTSIVVRPPTIRSGRHSRAAGQRARPAQGGRRGDSGGGCDRDAGGSHARQPARPLSLRAAAAAALRGRGARYEPARTMCAGLGPGVSDVRAGDVAVRQSSMGRPLARASPSLLARARDQSAGRAGARHQSTQAGRADPQRAEGAPLSGRPAGPAASAAQRTR